MSQSQQPKQQKEIPCNYFNSVEGCTNSDDKCKYSHKPMCVHIGCMQRGKTLTHLKENCGFIKINKDKVADAPVATAPVSEKTKLLEKIYERITKKLAGKFTGMFGEAFNEPELQEILDNESSFDENIKLACKTLANA